LSGKGNTEHALVLTLALALPFRLVLGTHAYLYGLVNVTGTQQ